MVRKKVIGLSESWIMRQGVICACEGVIIVCEGVIPPWEGEKKCELGVIPRSEVCLHYQKRGNLPTGVNTTKRIPAREGLIK